MPNITWDQPASATVAYVEIHYCATETGTYALLAAIDAKDGDGNWVLSYSDNTNPDTTWYKIRFLNVALTGGPYSTARQAPYDIVTYTTVTLVREQLTDLTIDITDTMIRGFIKTAECDIDGIMRYSFKTVFDASKHGSIQRIVTKMAALDCVKYDIVGQFGVVGAQALIDSLSNDITIGKKELSNIKAINYLRSL
jgi:hypothetical protein